MKAILSRLSLFEVFFVITTSIVLLLSVVNYSFVGCRTIPVNPYDPPTYCKDACNNLFELNCPGWRGSPGEDEAFGTTDDVPCIDVCANVVSEETATLNQACVSHAKTCAEVEACFDVN
jgi:hypothetical protein